MQARETGHFRDSQNKKANSRYSGTKEECHSEAAKKTDRVYEKNTVGIYELHRLDILELKISRFSPNIEKMYKT